MPEELIVFNNQVNQQAKQYKLTCPISVFQMLNLSCTHFYNPTEQKIDKLASGKRGETFKYSQASVRYLVHV